MLLPCQSGIGYSEKEKLVHIQDYVMTKAMGEYILNTRVPVESVEEKFETENRGTDKTCSVFVSKILAPLAVTAYFINGSSRSSFGSPHNGRPVAGTRITP